MGDVFEVDTSEMEKAAKAFHGYPKQFAKCTSYVLNHMAHGTQNAAIEVLRERMVIRNMRFVMGRLKVQHSWPTLPIENQKAYVGSMATARFTGWTEQQTGESTARTRTINLLARRGDKLKVAVGAARLKPGKHIHSYNDYPGAYPPRKELIMMQHLSRQKSTEPFFITKHPRMMPGLYRFYRGKPKLLQVFAKKQPDKIPWMTDATKRYLQRENMGAVWARTVTYNLKR
jgi:hypothetical protein